MDKQMVKNSLPEGQYIVNNELLESIKNFMDDLSTVTINKNFQDYHTIVKRIDESKVKSYIKLINGFKVFFENNSDILTEGNFNALKDPNISYITDNGSFTFNFQKTFQDAEEADQDIIKDHLNHIWNILNNTNKSPEELYIDKVFKDLQSRFSADMTREEQLSVVKDIFKDFQENSSLDMSVTIKAACTKSRQLLSKNTDNDNSTMLLLVDMVEEIDINNFDMIQLLGLVAKISALFNSQKSGEGNSLNQLLSSVLNLNQIPPIERLKLEDNDNS